MAASRQPAQRCERNDLARIEPEELPRRKAGEDVGDQRKPRLVEEVFALFFADRDAR